MSTKKITTIALFAAVSMVLLMVVRVPIFPMLPFLEYDPADIPIIICTMIYGPWVGLILTTIVCFFQGLTFSAASGVIGIAMHFVATGTFVLVFGLLYKKFKTVVGAIGSGVVGIICWVASMVAFNILLTPLFMHIPRKDVFPILLPMIVPFNLIKSGVNTAIALAVFFALNKYYKWDTVRLK